MIAIRTHWPERINVTSVSRPGSAGGSSSQRCGGSLRFAVGASGAAAFTDTVTGRAAAVLTHAHRSDDTCGGFVDLYPQL